MKDLTESSIVRNILHMALPIAAGMFFQTLYFLIDLYFVAGLGDAALAGVGAAGNVMFVVFAVTQVLGVGTVALISHAVGRKDRADATLQGSRLLDEARGFLTREGDGGYVALALEAACTSHVVEDRRRMP